MIDPFPSLLFGQVLGVPFLAFIGNSSTTSKASPCPSLLSGRVLGVPFLASIIIPFTAYPFLDLALAFVSSKVYP